MYKEEMPNHINRNMSKSVFLRGQGLLGIFYSLIVLKQLLSWFIGSKE
jgi:hypothetical protein